MYAHVYISELKEREYTKTEANGAEPLEQHVIVTAWHKNSSEENSQV